jgi:thiamine transport system substrate-binding protein
MRANGLKVTKGWSEAYYTEFTRNGGSRPLVVSYASSPAAEVFYSKEKITEPPTASLSLKGGCSARSRAWRWCAAASSARLRSASSSSCARAGAGGLQTSMWMYAAEPRTPRPDVMRHAAEPTAFDNPCRRDDAARGADWVSRWTRVVLK